ncbi:di-trans,poly-cis-decaprenylcistransferase [Patescibacteria group bacterium]|nr:di-trans,poly-cis-decaprenylcistransferase [Patescibacteria group bacterium]MBU4142170.1 di-trans,poly-cis-decaprenylcistransferase [Patescibacteria group bacterium]MBU4339114.1 di-trans,poly-cis-decaprenylcistransferase [Patescibacteria group bacterium]MBU4579620.1 di-trans,poly-cis-decaprenylcistransferase [Patescibacteria group bacterium]
MAEKLKNIPRHVAFIMDGNRRWAMNHMLEAWKGHESGALTVKEIIKEAVRLKIPYFSFWGSSLDNIAKRSKEEVSCLFKIFKNNFIDLAKDKDIHQNKIKVSVFGRWRELFPRDVKEAIERAIEATKGYNEHFLNVFLAYSGIDEMEEAVKKISLAARKNPKIKITAETIKKYLFTKKLPSVDYLVRTGGNPHLSGGFMMWETADAQLFFTDKHWPDFTKEDFRAAIEEYGRRQRKFGA